MLALIALWALAEATLFFIVADVPIMALGIRRGVKPALIGAIVAAVFAALGGSIIWLWAQSDPSMVHAVMWLVPGIDDDLVLQVVKDWGDNGAIGMATGSFSGVPYKLYAFAAGTMGGGWNTLTLFFFASILARLPRFLLVALVSGWVGPQLIARFGAGKVWLAFALAWAGFYVVYWSAMGF